MAPILYFDSTKLNPTLLSGAIGQAPMHHDIRNYRVGSFLTPDVKQCFPSPKHPSYTKNTASSSLKRIKSADNASDNIKSADNASDNIKSADNASDNIKSADNASDKLSSRPVFIKHMSTPLTLKKQQSTENKNFPDFFWANNTPSPDIVSKNGLKQTKSKNFPDFFWANNTPSPDIVSKNGPKQTKRSKFSPSVSNSSIHHPVVSSRRKSGHTQKKRSLHLPSLSSWGAGSIESVVKVKEKTDGVNLKRSASAPVSLKNVTGVAMEIDTHRNTLHCQRRPEKGANEKRTRRKKSTTSSLTKLTSPKRQRKKSRKMLKIRTSQTALSDNGSDNPISITNFRFKPLHGDGIIPDTSPKIGNRMSTLVPGHAKPESRSPNKVTYENKSKTGKKTKDGKTEKQTKQINTKTTNKSKIESCPKIKTKAKNMTNKLCENNFKGNTKRTNTTKCQVQMENVTGPKKRENCNTHVSTRDGTTSKVSLDDVNDIVVMTTNTSQHGSLDTLDERCCEDKCVQVDMDLVDTSTTNRNMYSQIHYKVLNPPKTLSPKKYPRKFRVNISSAKKKKSDEFRLAMQRCASYTAQQNSKNMTSEKDQSVMEQLDNDVVHDLKSECPIIEKSRGDLLLENIKAKIANCQGKCTLLPSAISVISHNDPKTTGSVFQRHSYNSPPQLNETPEVVRETPSRKDVVASKQIKNRPKKRKPTKKLSCDINDFVTAPNPKHVDDEVPCSEGAPKTDLLEKSKSPRKKRIKLPPWDRHLRTFIREWQSVAH